MARRSDRFPGSLIAPGITPKSPCPAPEHDAHPGAETAKNTSGIQTENDASELRRSEDAMIYGYHTAPRFR